MNRKKYKNALYESRVIRDLKELWEESASMYADRPAYYVKKQRGGQFEPINYKEAYDDSLRFGTGLLGLGLQGKHVTIVGENSYDWVIAYMSIVNGLGVVAPVDKELSAGETLNLVKRADSSAIIYGKKEEKKIESILADLPQDMVLICMGKPLIEGALAIDDVREAGQKAMDAGDYTYKFLEVDPEALCALLFTSGTTGMAKGVMLSHRSIAQNVEQMSKYVHIPEGGIGLSVLPMHHSYEMTCHILTAYYQGVSIGFCEGLKYIQKNMQELHATVMLSVPLIFETMHKRIMKKAASDNKLETLRAAIALSKRLRLYENPPVVKRMFKDVHEQFGSSVYLFIAGGAGINPDVVEDFQAMGFPMIQGYGMTENSPIIALNRDRCSKARSVGMPLPGTRVRIVDKDETGVGEIITRGPSLMLGYYKNEEATAEVIRDGWLYTGDYGYIDADGYIYISGRKKNVIVAKNGKNVFPEEVEFYLLRNPYIEDAFVFGEEDADGDTTIKAIIYPNWEKFKEDLGDLTEEENLTFFRHQVDEANKEMPSYKQVRRVGIRREPFATTTTRKIKRFSPENFHCDLE